MTISLIAAIGRNLEIGWDGCLPWHLPNDLNHFKETTKNKVVIMGRSTYESMSNVSWKERIVYVLSRNYYHKREINVAISVSDAIKKSQQHLPSRFLTEIVVIGGVEVFREALPLIDRAYITLVEGTFQADRYFPVGLEYFFDWNCDKSTTYFPDARNANQHTIYQFSRPSNT